ncbi:cupin domain-containing protein [bacterium]|nr:cupin domain-containing protein [bacterium]
MKTIEVKNAKSLNNPHGIDARKIYDTKNAVVVYMNIEPGKSLKSHITPVDVFFYVLTGRGIVEVGEEKLEVGPDTLIESPANIAHCWYNEGNKPLRILVAKVPRPTEATKMNP